LSRYHSFYDTVNQLAGDGVSRGILQLFTKDDKLVGNTMLLEDKAVINFGSCSFLGLEFDLRLKESAKRAIDNYGTQFSSARIYVSSGYYEELEDLLGKIFGSPTLAAPTTTLGHIATIPVILRDDDAIVLDHQVHNTVQNAVNLVKFRGVHVEMIRHNRMDMLEDRVKVLRQKHKRIWYMADGIFSMYGDYTPVNEVYELMDKYPELYYYVDDAHGMSCFGKHGKGYVLSQQPIHEKMMMVTSLNKAYASGGSALVFPNKEWARKVRNTGGPFLSSGPMQPASLGAAIASAKIHLSDEIYTLQGDLQENIKYANLMLRKYGLPNVAENNSPIFFVGVSLPKMGFNMIRRLLNEGYYTNIGVFPTVPMKNTGIRFTITRLHTFEQIESMVAAMAYHYPRALEEEEFSMDKVYRAFKMQPPKEREIDKAVKSLVNQSGLKVQHETTINAIDKNEWDCLLGGRGTFDWNGLKFLEDSFNDNQLPEDNWKFDYLIIKDLSGKPVLATFLTTALAKDDMLSPAEVSGQIEEKRKTEGNPYYLTSKTLMMGSLLTEGEHLYLDRSSHMWKDAMQLLFEKIAELQEKYNTTVVSLRDFDSQDEEMDTLLTDNGFFKAFLPENHVLEQFDWCSKEEYIERLSSNSRRHLRKHVLRHEDKYEAKVVNCSSIKDTDYWYQLYLNVKANSLALNTFALPYKVFQNMADDKNWDVITLTLKPEFDQRKERKPVAVMFSYINNNIYNPMVLGLDYSFNKEYKCYRQALYRVVMRAKELGLSKVRLGYSATIEKRKFGAKAFTSAAYMQVKDHYNMEVLGTMSMIKHS